MKQELIDMAKQAGIQEGEFKRYKGEEGEHKAYMMLPEELEAFASLVAAAEREACAKMCEEYAIGLERNYSEIIADKIRARGETK